MGSSTCSYESGTYKVGPQVKLRMPSGWRELGINFDDINECGSPHKPLPVTR